MAKLVLCFYLFSLLPFIARATVPANETFKFLNEGDYGPYSVEYGGSYRVLEIYNSPFQLCFYNTTPNAFTLALRMGTQLSESMYLWVWEANRGRPVRENASLTFGTDGNLVLADSDGKIAWQTNTANKGVVGFKLLPNGNMVLHDSKGRSVWQSFDYPTDTLLVGQSLRANGTNKLVSRLSDKVNFDGPYSLVMKTEGLFLSYKSSNSPIPSHYFTFHKGHGESLTLTCTPDTDEGFAYNLVLEYQGVVDISAGRPKYNSTLSFLRLGVDGNLKVYTFYDKVFWGAWEETFTVFDRYSVWENECQLPERCGSFGLCEDNQCVACPGPKGLMGWSKNCKAQKVTSCNPSTFHYYKIEGVDHFTSKYNRGEGPMKESDCGKKCTNNCKCLGYFYNRDTSRCWIAYDLKTLPKAKNSNHVGYIKVPNK